MVGLKMWYKHLLSQVIEKATLLESSWMSVLQEQQMQSFIAQGLPMRKQEAWHYTDISAITNQPLTLVDASGAGAATPLLKAAVARARLEKESHLVVFVDGHFNQELSSIQALPEGVILSNVASILKNQPELLKPWLLQLAEQSTDQPFLCMNTALFSDGLFLSLPDNLSLPLPIHLLCLSDAKPLDKNMAHLRHTLFAGRHSQFSLFEEYAAVFDSQEAPKFYFNTVVTQVYAGIDAVIEHYKLQNESSACYHLGYLSVKQEQGSCVHLHNFSLGAQLARDDLHVHLDAPQANCELNGLYMLTNQQHSDQQIVVHHHAGHSQSEQLYRGVIRGEAEAVFNGRVVVHPGAQKSVAKQSNQNILLS